MTKRMIDTNIIIRFLTNDHEIHSPAAFELMKRAVEGKIILYLDPMAVAESVWVLQSVYKFTKPDIADKLIKLVEFEGIDSPQKDVLLLALELYHRYNVDYADAFLAAMAEKMGNVEVVTYNSKDFSKMGVNHSTPADLAK